MRRYLGLALACVLAAISFSALAMGLGEIRLNSWLNQRLDAEIELVSAAADEIESLEITLADDAIYERYGLERSALLNSIRFDVVRRPNGTAYIKVTSTEPIREPFLTLFVIADWSRGRLMREYTLLIDPPAFARREPEPAPEPQLPARTPAAEPAPAEPFVEQAAEAAALEPAAPIEETRGDVISIPPLEADARPEFIEAAPAEPEMGGNYGPIQRNETLWGIARRLRPDDSVTINQMMLALYRANPEAFQGNINRLKAGYILRIPEYSEITSLTRRDAFNEVKRQNEDWRAERAAPAPATAETAMPDAVEPEPELTLVAPEEDFAPATGTGVGAGGEAGESGMGTEESLDPAVDDVDEGAVDLGVEDDTQDRLLDLEDESMQALQEQELPVPLEAPATETAPEEMPAEDTLAEDAQGAEPPPLPPPGEETAGAAPGEPVTEEQAAEDASPGETAGAETIADAQPAEEAPAARNAAPVPLPREPGLVEQLKALAFSPLGMGIGAAILVLLLAGFLVIRKRREATQAKAAAAMAGWDDEQDEAATVIDGDDEDVTVVTSREDDGDIATVFGHGMEHEDTGTTQLSEEDAESELAGGDKTQMLPQENVEAGNELVDTMVGGKTVTLDDNDPLSEADFHMAYGLYDQAADVVQKAAERDPSRQDYQAKLAEIHFAANNSDGFLDAARRLKELGGSDGAEWDNVAIMGRQIAPNDPLFAAGGTTTSVDLDFGAAADEVAAEDSGDAAGATPVAADDSLDFDVSLDTGDAPEAPAEAPPAPSGDSAADSPDGLDFDLDVGGLEETESPAPAADPEPAPAADTGDDDFNFDLGEPEEDAAATETPETAGLDDAFTGDDEQTQTDFDKALEELSAFVDTNVPEQDAGDAVTDDAGSGLNLDDYSFDEDASAAGETEGTGDDEDDIGEAGTKLDLARAYIDMGDPDGARGILEEVIADGDEDQQREARELLDQLA